MRRTIRARVTEARNIQRLRFATSKGVATNSAMRPKQVREHCALDTESQGYLEQAMEQMHLTDIFVAVIVLVHSVAMGDALL